MNREDKTQVALGIFAIFVVASTLGLWGLMVFAAEDMSFDPPQYQRQLVATVKGSIYETGEYMTVFGACLDQNDLPIEGALAYLSAWYPNGTQYISNDSMSELDADGHFMWGGAMDVVQGTYLTRLECVALNQTAFAFGEWQNPVWVNRISNLTNFTINAFNSTWQNITFLHENMTENFNYTNSLINSNVSYLAYLLELIINGTGPGYFNSTVTNVVFEEGNVYYWRDWTVKTRAYDYTGSQLYSPEVYCLIDTNMHDAEYMIVEGEHFTSTLFIDNKYDLEYNITCAYT